MSGEGQRCPETGCADNRDGICVNGAAMPFGVAASAFFMPGPMNFAAPLGPALGLTKNSAASGAGPPMDGDLGSWRNCPRRKQGNSIQ